MEMVNQYEQLDKDFEMFEQVKAQTTCDCKPQLVNAGSGKATIRYDTQGCKLHCTHSGINTMAAEWYCSCGASHKEKPKYEYSWEELAEGLNQR